MSKSKLDPELKAKWLAALRSGDYKQTTGRLKDDSGFCCMGVLLDVVDPNGWKPLDVYELSVDGMTRRLVGDICSAPTHPALGIDFDVNNRLVGLNDYEGKRFKQIANWIEANL